MRYAIEAAGLVQGVGFRYYVSQSAAKLGLTGWVKNEWDGSVTVQAQGSARTLKRFLQDIQSGNRWAQVDRLEYRSIPERANERTFEILH
ncbi:MULTISPECIES: acylphosphatase [Caproicibacterium]|uniref:acylphosphatase n=1 Tax=Caproicibacterium argilliputei TaxID=3030016 RepID=A0AA97DBI6_9FIRM|nr:acylphosphatase [Caproicibacterium argilliputei]WOC33222.1 acylphosphatase [Caproicibacterium argilliputei]